MVTHQGHHVTVKLLTARRSILCLAALVLCVTACSSGVGKHASPTTTIATASSAAASTTTISPSQVAAKLVPCRFTLPTHLMGDNGGIKGLAKKLVPIDALVVRICDYSDTSPYPLIGAAVLKGSEAEALEREANRLQREPERPTCNDVPGVSMQVFVFTFANASHHVFVYGGDECAGEQTNGAFNVGNTRHWLNVVAAAVYEGATVATPAVPCRLSQLSATGGWQGGGGSMLGGISITNHATTPCVLTGHPAVVLQDPEGGNLSIATTNFIGDGRGLDRPVLAPSVDPGTTFVLDWGNWCGPQTPVSVQVVLPNLTGFLTATSDHVDGFGGRPRCDAPAYRSVLSIGPFERPSS